MQQMQPRFFSENGGNEGQRHFCRLSYIFWNDFAGLLSKISFLILSILSGCSFFPVVSVWFSVLIKMKSVFRIVFPQLFLNRFLGWPTSEMPSESAAGPFSISLHHVTEN